MSQDVWNTKNNNCTGTFIFMGMCPAERLFGSHDVSGLCFHWLIITLAHCSFKRPMSKRIMPFPLNPHFTAAKEWYKLSWHAQPLKEFLPRWIFYKVTSSASYFCKSAFKFSQPFLLRHLVKCSFQDIKDLQYIYEQHSYLWISCYLRVVWMTISFWTPPLSKWTNVLEQ